MAIGQPAFPNCDTIKGCENNIHLVDTISVFDPVSGTTTSFLRHRFTCKYCTQWNPKPSQSTYLCLPPSQAQFNTSIPGKCPPCLEISYDDLPPGRTVRVKFFNPVGDPFVVFGTDIGFDDDGTGTVIIVLEPLG